MTKTTAPRVRALNLYTVESNGQPVAQAMAISQAEAVLLYVESVQQPTMSARLSTPLEARTLAGLPLLTRGEPVRDTATADLFGDVPAAPVSPVVGAVVDPVLLATYCPPVELPVKTYPPAVLAQIVAELAPDHVEDVREMVPPQHAPIEAVTEWLASGEQEPAAEQPGEPAGCLDAAPTAVELAGVSSAVDDDGGRELTAAEQLVYEAQGAARFAQHHGSELKRQAEAHAARAGGKIVARYRNTDGSTWTGRGLKPKWLLAALEAGRTQDEFLIDTNGAQA